MPLEDTKPSNMLRLLFIAIISVLFQCPSHAGDKISDSLNGINKNYGRLSGFSLIYSREVITRTMTMLGNQVKGDPATGRIHFKSPHFLRLDQETPGPETIIANRDTLWWYIPQKKCVHKYPSKKFGRELELLGEIFRGINRIRDRFQVTLANGQKQGEYQLELKPDPPWEEIDRVTLILTPNHYIRVMDIHNQLGSITRFKLEGLKEKKFNEDFFQFIVPDGVRLIEEGE
ncbi:MAG: outer membrane lipoprotein carrier protein LolA [Desulfobacterales bacterium]|nr:outer membrane lipoprotein carrier protein LolA [Desulfobacterales bacterium]